MATFLITGASRGIGLELARQAAARGDGVLACARTPAAAEGLVAASTASDGRIETFTLDVTDPAKCADLAHLLSERTIDVLVCNAGVYLGRGGLDDPALTPEAWSEVLTANVTGVFNTVRAFRPLLRTPGGRIAVISSRMGSNGAAKGGSYAYRASKAAATNLATNLALDLKEKGISVGSYHPGWVRTDMGTDAAAISVEESAAGLLARFDALGPETTGVFEGHDGTALPF